MFTREGVSALIVVCGALWLVAMSGAMFWIPGHFISKDEDDAA